MRAYKKMRVLVIYEYQSSKIGKKGKGNAEFSVKRQMKVTPALIKGIKDNIRKRERADTVVITNIIYL